MSEYSKRRDVAAVAAGIAVGIVLTAVLTGLIRAPWETHSQSPPGSPGNGLTFSEAWSTLNASLETAQGGPWELESVLGMATMVSAFPVPDYGQSTGLNNTMVVCGRLNGTTVWNSTDVPVFTGAFESGAAPFWSLIFGNNSSSYLYATVLLGTPHLYPVSVSTKCIEAAGLTTYPSQLAPISKTNLRWSSSFVAGRAYNAVGKEFAKHNTPFGEYYVLGVAQLTGLDTGPGWGVDLYPCDMANVPEQGLKNYSDYLMNALGVGFEDNGWESCDLPYYNLTFTEPVSNLTPVGSESTYLSSPFQVTSTWWNPVSDSNVTIYDGWGLQAWMMQPTLDLTGGLELQPNPAGCVNWVGSIQDCPANSTGWYAVLLSANGEWLDSYPASTAGSEWSLPNVLVSSHDSLVIVSPSAADFSRDTLEVYGVEEGPAITGPLEV